MNVDENETEKFHTWEKEYDKTWYFQNHFTLGISRSLFEQVPETSKLTIRHFSIFYCRITL